jgi:diketogulonate reductase-like aldo/keto reductase
MPWFVTMMLYGVTHTHTVQISEGVFYPVIQLGACTDCSTKQVCCGSNLSASLPVWAQAHEESDMMAIDTQLRYNDTSIVATVLKKIERPRNRTWITSKIDPKVYCNAPDPTATARSMIQQTLLQLNMSYIDLLLLHEPCDRKGKPHPSDQLAWTALEEAVQNKWARAIGLDKFTSVQIEALNGTKPAVLMAPMGLTSHDDEILEYCQNNGIHFNAYGVVHGRAFAV